MDENKEDKDESKEEMGKTATTEGQSEMAPQDEDPLKKAFQSALNQNVADSELDVKEKSPTDGHAMTARDDTPQQEQQPAAAGVGASADPAPASDNEDDGTPAAAPTPPGIQQTQGASPVAPPPEPKIGKKILSGLQGREMTATPIDENARNEPSSSENGDEQPVVVTPKKTSTKRKKTKKKKKKSQHQQQQMAPPPFYQFPFFGMLPQVQMQERRKRAKKKAPSTHSGDKPSNGIGNRGEDAPAAAPAAIPAAAAAKAPPPPPAPEAAAPKKIEAVKIQQKEDDNGYLNLADLQAEEKKVYGEQKVIGAPGDEYICLADANDAAGGTPSKEQVKDTMSGKAVRTSKPPEPPAPKSPGLAAKSPAASKDEWQDAVLTPRPGEKAKEKAPSLHQKTPPPPHKEPPKKHGTHTAQTMTSDASVSRKTRGKKGPQPGAPVNPRQLPAPVTSVGPNRGPKTPVRNPAKEVTPVKGQPTKRKTAAPVPPPKKGVAQQPYVDPKKKNASKDEFQDAVLTPIQKNQPKGGGTRR